MSKRYPRQDIFTLPLQPSLRDKLQARGFHNLQDLENISVVDLATELGIGEVR